MPLHVVCMSTCVPFAIEKCTGSMLSRSEEPFDTMPCGGSSLACAFWGCKLMLERYTVDIEYHEKHAFFSTRHIAWMHRNHASATFGGRRPRAVASTFSCSDPSHRIRFATIVSWFAPPARLICRTVVRPREDSLCYSPTVSSSTRLLPNGCSDSPMEKGACSGLSFQELPIEPEPRPVRNDTNPSPSTSTSRPNRTDASRSP